MYTKGRWILFLGYIWVWRVMQTGRNEMVEMEMTKFEMICGELAFGGFVMEELGT